MRSLALTMCLTAAAAAVQAQDINLSQARLPRTVESRISAVIENPDTKQIKGETTIADTTRGAVFVHGGPLTLRGRIDGELIVFDGNVVFEQGASVTGDVTVINGDALGLELASIDGTVTVYGEGFNPLRSNERVYTVHNGRVYRDDDRRDWGYSTISIKTGWNYNRVEGLPVEIGPTIETRGANPTRVEAHAIWRSAVGGLFDAEDWGYSVKAEQFFGNHHNFRVGAALVDAIEPIENWQMRPIESALSTFVLHEDYRDYYEREGWSAYARFTPRGTGLKAQMSYNDENHYMQPARDPWTLFGGDPWRLQPLVDEQRYRSVNGALTWDRRNDDDFATAGWYIRGELSRVLNRDITHGLVDARWYRAVADNATLSLRAVGAGALNDATMPPQFQHALGGAGSLPGYSLFTADCGARSTFATRDGDSFYGAYGCDKIAMFSAEYRGGFDIHIGNWGGWSWWDDDSYESYDNSINAHPNWVVFFDGGRGWTKSDALRKNTGALYDVGAGILIGDIGLYGAVPLNGSDRGMKFFLRVGPRF